MKPMETAPTDGTRCLVLSRAWGFCSIAGRYKPNGTQWVDAFHDGACWQEWCGNPRVRSTARLDPLGWAPLPSRQIE